jgi:hypothetical protein
MADLRRDREETSRNAVGRVFDSRWMMAFSVLAVLVAIAWALLERDPRALDATPTAAGARMARVELLGVPPDAEILLDGKKIDNTVFATSPHVRHALEVTDSRGRSWRQVLVADGSVSLVVELRTHFAEVEVSPSDLGPADD